jgi:hypothetical protein
LSIPLAPARNSAFSAGPATPSWLALLQGLAFLSDSVDDHSTLIQKPAANHLQKHKVVMRFENERFFKLYVDLLTRTVPVHIRGTN